MRKLQNWTVEEIKQYVLTGSMIRRSYSDSSHVTAPYKSSFYYFIITMIVRLHVTEYRHRSSTSLDEDVIPSEPSQPPTASASHLAAKSQSVELWTTSLAVASLFLVVVVVALSILLVVLFAGRRGRPCDGCGRRCSTQRSLLLSVDGDLISRAPSTSSPSAGRSKSNGICAASGYIVFWPTVSEWVRFSVISVDDLYRLYIVQPTNSVKALKSKMVCLDTVDRSHEN